LDCHRPGATLNDSATCAIAAETLQVSLHGKIVSESSVTAELEATVDAHGISTSMATGNPVIG
jgi:hypothetical protein